MASSCAAKCRQVWDRGNGLRPSATPACSNSGTARGRGLTSTYGDRRDPWGPDVRQSPTAGLVVIAIRPSGMRFSFRASLKLSPSPPRLNDLLGVPLIPGDRCASALGSAGVHRLPLRGGDRSRPALPRGSTPRMRYGWPRNHCGCSDGPGLSLPPAECRSAFRSQTLRDVGRAGNAGRSGPMALRPPAAIALLPPGATRSRARTSASSVPRAATRQAAVDCSPFPIRRER